MGRCRGREISGALRGRYSHFIKEPESESESRHVFYLATDKLDLFFRRSRLAGSRYNFNFKNVRVSDPGPYTLYCIT